MPSVFLLSLIVLVLLGLLIREDFALERVTG